MPNKNQNDNFHFDGFGIPESNYFKMPREWTDITAKINSLAEIKVVEYVLKHTWGFREFGIAKKITVDEFISGRRRKDGTRIDNGTGLSERGVRYGLDDAVRHGLLVEEVDDRDKGRIKKSYAIRMKVQPDEKLPEGTEETGVQSLHLGVQSLQSRGANFSPRTEKDTIERNLKKKDLSKFRKVQTHKKDGDEQKAPDQPYSEDIAALIEDLSKYHLHDYRHINSNITQAQNLWRQSKLSEEEFIRLLYEAKKITLQRSASIRKTVNGDRAIKNRAPYFFKVLQDLIRKFTLEQQRQALLGAFRKRTQTLE